MPFKIYYIDDEKELLDIFVDTMNFPEATITTFEDPIRAIAHISKFPPDLLFIDYRLTITTGDQIAIGLDPSISKVLITGELDLKTKYNFDKVFLKPIDYSEVETYILHRIQDASKKSA